eukprot:TRINITY_DN10579_c0_g1_i1.p1 TRINITY_DN10579_c0_g1~~TRINITY_DN10579_c0_g1_i1.p1  ORF type:complete len:272 (-),score=67.33 TRINITY_DN10579_c0_g1_i1:184-942(-)
MEALLKRELAKLPVVGCPTPGCENFIEMDCLTVPLHCVCSACSAEFCSLCKRDYHYRIGCSELMKLTKDWIEWNSNGRRNYHQLLEKEQKKEVEGYEKEKKKIEERNLELLNRYQDLVEDEMWKEQNCRACPHCGRPIQKLSGCDSMLCGSDYHGGNLQTGCGQTLKWTQSQPYKSLGLVRPEMVEYQPPNPKQRTFHGESLTCDNCQKNILGLRFSCVHCRLFNLCENCEFKVDHHKNHVFRIFEITEEVS